MTFYIFNTIVITGMIIGIIIILDLNLICLFLHASSLSLANCPLKHLMKDKSNQSKEKEEVDSIGDLNQYLIFVFISFFFLLSFQLPSKCYFLMTLWKLITLLIQMTLYGKMSAYPKAR